LQGRIISADASSPGVDIDCRDLNVDVIRFIADIIPHPALNGSNLIIIREITCSNSVCYETEKI
jgi:hypothetical protein